MPAISMFYGIIIYMYFLDNKQHQMPHIHVKYQDHEVIVASRMEKFLKVAFPTPKWNYLRHGLNYKEELEADWELAVSGQLPFKIDPLR